MIIHHSLPPVTTSNQWVSIDTEMFGQDEKHMHRPWNGTFACLTICPDDENVYIMQDERQVAEALKRVQASVWVGQNLKYDIVHWRRWADVQPRKKLYDTMLIERILFNGYYDGFGLKDLSRRYLRQKLDKEVRDTFSNTTNVLTSEQIEYACKDAWVTRQIALEQKKLMTSDDRYVWSEIDLPAMWAFMAFKGFGIDVEKWKSLAEYNVRMKEEIDASLPFNPRSPKQVIAWMLANGVKKLESSDEDHMEEVIRKYPNTPASEMAKRMLESKSYSTNASKYGFDFINNFLEEEDGIHVINANYNLIGAATGRTSCDSPNMQNIPSRDTKVYRECFISRPNHSLVIADYGAQEPRLLAYVSQDEYLLDCFASGRDPYISLAKDAFDEEITKKDPKRKIYKDVVLGIGYGLTKHGLSNKFNISKDEAQHLIDKASKLLHGAAAWGEKQSRESSFVTTPFGRRYWLNPYSNSHERNARNSPIQGGAADMMKRTLGRMYQDWPFPFPFCCVGSIHDETVFDFPDEYVDQGKEYVQTYMEEESTKMVKGQIRFIAEVFTGKTWAEK